MIRTGKQHPWDFFCWGLFNEKIVRADPSGFSQTKKTYVFHLMHIVYICTHIYVYVHIYIVIDTKAVATASKLLRTASRLFSPTA